MSIDVSGKNVRLWRSDRETRDGRTWSDYSVGISKKNQDGGYARGYIKVRFGRDIELPERVENGTNIDFEGYITLDTYRDRSGNEVKKDMIMITAVKFNDLPQEAPDYGDSFSQAEEDIPF